MSKIARNISILNEYTDVTWYTHTCSCGCGEHYILEVSSPEDTELISLNIYADVKAYNRKSRNNILINFFLNVYWRICTALKVLFKGHIELQTEIIMTSKGGVADYISALQKASKVFDRS
jgi:hypothetical protein